MNSAVSDHRPAVEWRALASQIAGAGRLRLSKDGGRTYPRRWERLIGDLPNQPAAVLIYDRTGAARTFCIDLDVARGGIDAVERDYRAVSAILSRLGLRYFADRSPNGGIHIYVPLAEPLPHAEAAAAARALAARTPSMDPMPMLGIDSGCIRPPGARHKSGGHQQLIGSLSAAYDATQRPTSPQAWARFVDELDVAAHLSDPAADAVDLHVVDEPQLTPRGRWTAPDARYQRIARTGAWDGYRSPSEARQGVIWACVAAGWSLNDVIARVHDGTWPGLAGMYARYRKNSRHGALVRDWRRAVAFEKHRHGTTRTEPVRVGTTSRSETHGAGVYRQVRTWLNAVRLTHYVTRRDALAQRAVLHALAEAAIKTGSTTVEFGNRSLAIATGLDQATVGKVLRQLENDPRPLISLTQPARGIRANAWTLTVPQDLEDTVDHLSWRRGRIHGVRPAFRVLGLPAAFIYAALEHAAGPTSGRDLAHDAGLGHTAAYDALDTLAVHGLARRTRDGWIIGETNLDRLAEQLGVVDDIRAQQQRYRAERRAWWALLGIIRLQRPTGPVGTYDHAPPPPDELEPPPEPGWTAMDLLERELGAHVIAVDQRGA